jgi:serine/threonine protein phosphatase 1
MLRHLRNPFRAAEAPAPAVPPGERVYAIGDVHGCLEQLVTLLDLIDEDDARRGPARTTLVLLGDLVDRGPRSAEVVALAMALREERPGTRFLMGNHEELFLTALDGNEEALRLFCRVGGRETVLSYGLSPDAYESMDYEALHAWLAERVPAAQRDFLSAMEALVEIGDYAFVHAGVRPNVPLAQQKEEDLRWIRQPFLGHKGRFERMVVHGHTITPEVDRQAGRIGIDTGAYVTGRLTAIGLEGADWWLIQTQARTDA